MQSAINHFTSVQFFHFDTATKFQPTNLLGALAVGFLVGLEVGRVVICAKVRIDKKLSTFTKDKYSNKKKGKEIKNSTSATKLKFRHVIQQFSLFFKERVSQNRCSDFQL